MSPNPANALHDRLEQLRSFLQSQPAPASAVTPVSRAPSPSPSADDPAGIIHWLAGEVCRRVGIAVNESVRTKLGKIAGKVPVGELARWAERLAAASVDHPEWLSLVEMLTVHETYFLRDPGQFEFVRRSALADIVAERKSRPNPALRLWSAACSTGEEAYSLAFLAIQALADAGEVEIDGNGHLRFARRWTIEVLGSDLSRQAVRTAEAAVYRDFSLGAFRGLPQGYWRFFLPVEAGSATVPDEARAWSVRNEIRQLVRFRQFNLMAAEPPGRDFDVIFCRNVLVYFDPAGKRHVFNTIHRALKGEGVAVFGPTDIPDPTDLFRAQWGPSTVVYRKFLGAHHDR